MRELFWSHVFDLTLSSPTQLHIVVFPFTGINGLVEFQTRAAENKWRVMSVQQFGATVDAADVNAKEQLRQIKGTGTDLAHVSISLI